MLLDIDIPEGPRAVCVLNFEQPLYGTAGGCGGHRWTASGLYRVATLIRNNAPLGPYSRTMPWTLRWSWERGIFL